MLCNLHKLYNSNTVHSTRLGCPSRATLVNCRASERARNNPICRRHATFSQVLHFVFDSLPIRVIARRPPQAPHTCTKMNYNNSNCGSEPRATHSVVATLLLLLLLFENCIPPQAQREVKNWGCQRRSHDCGSGEYSAKNYATKSFENFLKNLYKIHTKILNIFLMFS